MTVDNFDLIRPLLNFRSDDDFYFLQVLLRKKDLKRNVQGTNNNRLVKAYYVRNLEYFDFIKPEVIELCNVFGARACINLNRRSYRKLAFQTLQKVTDLIVNEEYTKINKAYSSVCGKFSNETDKKWILDLDGEDFNTTKEQILKVLPMCRPEGEKFVAEIPSKSGLHIITKPFALNEFDIFMLDIFDVKWTDVIELHKNNPTNLYCP